MNNIFELSFINSAVISIFNIDDIIFINYEKLEGKDQFKIFIVIKDSPIFIDGHIHISLLNQLLDAYKKNKGHDIPQQQQSTETQRTVCFKLKVPEPEEEKKETIARFQKESDGQRVHFKLEPRTSAKDERIHENLVWLQDQLRWVLREIEKIKQSAD